MKTPELIFWLLFSSPAFFFLGYVAKGYVDLFRPAFPSPTPETACGKNWCGDVKQDGSEFCGLHTVPITGIEVECHNCQAPYRMPSNAKIPVFSESDRADYDAGFPLGACLFAGTKHWSERKWWCSECLNDRVAELVGGRS